MSLKDILQQAGFSGSGLDMAYAIAMAESGGNASAFNGNASTGDQSYGLFQINMLGDMGPERRRTYGLSSNDDLYDALRNAQVAYKMSKGGSDWSPWSTFTNGMYRRYLGQSGAEVSGQMQGASPAAAPTKGPAAFTPTINDFAPSAQAFVPKPAAAPGAAAATGSTSFRDRVIANALGVLGAPYSWGGGSPSGATEGFGKGKGIVGFDCSGLMFYAFGKAGMSLPRTSWPQLAMGERTSISNLRPGDLVGFGDGHHVAMYLGNNQIVESPGTGRYVHVRSLNSSDNVWGVRLNLPGD